MNKKTVVPYVTLALENDSEKSKEISEIGGRQQATSST